MKEVRKAVTGYIACQPTGYRTSSNKVDFTSLPEFPYGLDPLQLSRKEMGDYASQASDIGVNYIGSCCGAVACHVHEMARALGKVTAAERDWKSKTGKPMSAYEYYEHEK